MAPDRNFPIIILAHASRNDGLLCAVGMFDDPKLIRHLVVEALMDPSQEFDGCGAGQGAYAMHLIDGPLNDDVRPGLKGERAGFFLKLGTSQRPFDVARARVVSFDQVGVVAVHHTDEIGKFGCAVRMQPLSQPGGFPLNVDRKVCQFCSDLRPDFPPAFGRIRRLISGLMRPSFPVSISLQTPAA